MWNVKVKYRTVESPIIRGRATGEGESKDWRKNRRKGEQKPE